MPLVEVEILRKESQVDGSFNNGEILEKKPIGFPQDGGVSKPYSNIFYWAHAWTPNQKSTIGLHPHQGFEICSFILSGSINHYDTKQEKWISLNKDDVQIIRSRGGISHAEELLEKSEIFQIWFDPDISKSIRKEASYDDYSSNDFVSDESNGINKKTIVGKGSKMKMDTQDIEIYEFSATKNKTLELPFKMDYIYSCFVISGELKINDNNLKKGDFFKFKSTEHLSILVTSDLRLFVIRSPEKPNYKTYYERS